MEYLTHSLTNLPARRVFRFLTQPAMLMFLFIAVLAVSNGHAQVEAFEENMRTLNTTTLRYARIIIFSVSALLILAGMAWALMFKGGFMAWTGVILVVAFCFVVQVFPGIVEEILGWTVFNAL